MRIAIYGSAGTGKTTLANMISESCRIPMNPVGSRSVAAAMGFASPYDVDAAGRRAEFQRRLVTEKVAWEAEHDDFVTDRTTLDNIAYTVMHDVHAIDQELLDAAIDGFCRYEYVIFCPMSAFWSIGDDPVRVVSRVYHRIYEAVVDGLVADAVQVRIERETERGEYAHRLSVCWKVTKAERALWVQDRGWLR